MASGPVQDFLSARARELKLWIVAGTTPISDSPGERVAAASLVYDDGGQRAGRYDKIHLFDVDIPGKDERYRESGNIAPGTRMQLVPTPAGLLGLSVCYDMRFPELYRPMAAAGAQWFTVPAAFTVPTGRAHWETLLRARAIENLSFVVAPAQWGQHASGRETYGDSIIIDHWGTVLGRLRSGQGIVVRRSRSRGPALRASGFPGAFPPRHVSGAAMTAATDLANIDPLRTAREAILAPAGLDVGGVEQALGLVLGSAVDSADLYFQLSREESWGLEDGIVKEGSASIEQGVGVRALAGEKTGFAYSDEIMRPALEEAARAARAIAVRGGQGAVQAWRPVAGHQLYLPDDPLLSLADEQKIAWLERIDRETRRMDPRVVQVMASVHAVHELVLVAASDGVLAGGRAAAGAHERHA